MKLHQVLAILVLALGSFVLGLGVKFSVVYFLDMPNFFDGLAIVAAGLILVVASIWRLVKTRPR